MSENQHAVAPKLDPAQTAVTASGCYWRDEDDTNAFRQTLERLFEVVLVPMDHPLMRDHAGGGPPPPRRFTQQEIATLAGISSPYLGYLRSGARQRPKTDKVHRIEAAFRVPHGTLCPRVPEVAHRVNRQLQLFGELSKSGAIEIAERASQVRTPSGLEAIRKMVEHVLEIEAGQSAPDPGLPNRVEET